MPAPHGSPQAQALASQQLLIDFLCTPIMARAESPAPAWLLTPEGQDYLRHWSRGDYDGAFRVLDEANARNLRALFDTMWQDMLPPTPAEENTHG